MHGSAADTVSNLMRMHTQPGVWHWADRFPFEMIAITVSGNRSSWRSDHDQRLIKASYVC